MAEANHGSVVAVHYTGKLGDGTIFDSSLDGEPLRFTIGEGKLIPGFEEAVVGMQPGESRSAEITAQDAYGPRDEKLVWEVDRDSLPENLEPETGQMLESINNDGGKQIVVISQVSESTITLDGNHPLAGKDLHFEIKLVEIF
ncbi:MAG: peptidylprolyl isomerase [bacterium]